MPEFELCVKFICKHSSRCVPSIYAFRNEKFTDFNRVKNSEAINTTEVSILNLRFQFHHKHSCILPDIDMARIIKLLSFGIC